MATPDSAMIATACGDRWFVVAGWLPVPVGEPSWSATWMVPGGMLSAWPVLVVWPVPVDWLVPFVWPVLLACVV